MAQVWKVSFNGRRAVEEYTADLAGARIAFAGMRTGAASEAAPTSAARVREFFVAYAQAQCAMDGDYRSDVETLTDSHPSTILRVNGVVSQMEEFARAFACPPGTPMAPAARCIASWP